MTTGSIYRGALIGLLLLALGVLNPLTGLQFMNVPTGCRRGIGRGTA